MAGTARGFVHLRAEAISVKTGCGYSSFSTCHPTVVQTCSDAYRKCPVLSHWLEAGIDWTRLAGVQYLLYYLNSRLDVNATRRNSLGSIPASSDTAESEGGRWRSVWITYIEKIQQNPHLSTPGKFADPGIKTYGIKTPEGVPNPVVFINRLKIWTLPYEVLFVCMKSSL